MWNDADLLSILAAALHDEHERLTAEQAVHNIDAHDELTVHPILAAGLTAAGFGVLREQPYPSEWLTKPGRHRKKLPDESQRQRCDLVLTPSPQQTLIDPLRDQREDLADVAHAAGTLFAPLAEARRAVKAAAAPAGIAPDEAFWLEVKIVGQFCHTSGIPGPNRQYAAQLRRAGTDDLKKLAADRAIVHGGLLLVLFADSDTTARHDLGVIIDRCAAAGHLRAMPAHASLPILDRIGNRACSLSLLMAPVAFGKVH